MKIFKQIGFIKLAAIVFLCGVHTTANAISLEQYGLTVTFSGFVDNRSGLRWLDTDLSLGTTADVENLLSQGWRVATEWEVQFLLTREQYEDNEVFGYSGNNPLQYDQFLIMLDVLGIVANEEFVSSWMCRNYGDVAAHCSGAFGPYFEEPLVFAAMDFDNIDEFGPTTTLQMYTFITEAYLFGTYDTPCPDCVGRTMLVRAVPLPASIWGFVAALGVLRLYRGKKR